MFTLGCADALRHQRHRKEEASGTRRRAGGGGADFFFKKAWPPAADSVFPQCFSLGSVLSLVHGSDRIPSPQRTSKMKHFSLVNNVLAILAFSTSFATVAAQTFAQPGESSIIWEPSQVGTNKSTNATYSNPVMTSNAGDPYV